MRIWILGLEQVLKNPEGIQTSTCVPEMSALPLEILAKDPVVSGMVVEATPRDYNSI